MRERERFTIQSGDVGRLEDVLNPKDLLVSEQTAGHPMTTPDARQIAEQIAQQAAYWAGHPQAYSNLVEAVTSALSQATATAEAERDEWRAQCHGEHDFAARLAVQLTEARRQVWEEAEQEFLNWRFELDVNAFTHADGLAFIKRLRQRAQPVEQTDRTR